MTFSHARRHEATMVGYFAPHRPRRTPQAPRAPPPRWPPCRPDNGLVFTSRSYTALVRGYGLQQEFIIPHSPEQNGMVERVIRTLKEQCVHRHRFETLQHASRVIGEWIGFYSHRRPRQALGMRTPAEAYALAA